MLERKGKYSKSNGMKGGIYYVFPQTILVKRLIKILKYEYMLECNVFLFIFWLRAPLSLDRVVLSVLVRKFV